MVCEKRAFKILQNSQENTSARAIFLIKLQAPACIFIRKETLAEVLSFEFYEIFKNIFLQNISGRCLISATSVYSSVYTEVENDVSQTHSKKAIFFFFLSCLSYFIFLLQFLLLFISCIFLLGLKVTEFVEMFRATFVPTDLLGTQHFCVKRVIPWP